MAIRRQVSKTRPSDTTQYAVGDVIAEAGTSTVWTFTGMCERPGGQVIIKTATLDMSTAAGTALQANLMLFRVAPATVNDNAACAITDNERLEYVGTIVFATPTNAILGASYTSNQELLVNLAGGSTTLYGVLLAVNTYTPASAEVITITLNGITPIQG